MMRVSATDVVVLTPMEKVFPSVKNLKKALECRVLGVEIYSLLAFPEIGENETRDRAIEKLKKAGFRVLEKDGNANVIDALERPTGKQPYPFSLKVTVKPNKYDATQICKMIEKQTGFEVMAMIMWSRAPNPNYEFVQNEELTIRDIFNRLAANAKGTWIAYRFAFSSKGYRDAKSGLFVESNVPIIRENDSAVLQF